MDGRTEALGTNATTGADGHRLARTVYRITRRFDNSALRLLDAGVVLVAWLLAYLAGFEGKIPNDFAGGRVVYLGLPVVTQLIANQVAGLYGPVWRYASVEEAARVLAAVGGGTTVSTLLLASSTELTDTRFPVFTTPAVAALLMLLGCGGIRFQARLFALERRGAAGDTDEARVRTLIVGTGRAGASLAHELRTDVRSGLRLVGFVDDDPRLRGRSVRGLRILGVVDDLERICRDNRIERILVAIPGAGREEIQAIVTRALQTDAQVKVLPHAGDLVSGPLLRSLRDLDLTDLLGREHAPVDTAEIADYLAGATVLITGAGGSIGSEIVRQVSRYGPARLLVLDRDESLLHEVTADVVDAVPVLADIRDRVRVREVFERYRPDVVFHAAAHKHVPILEKYPVEAIQTNLLGTWWLALTAADFGCRRFVLISTDKAADPCSVMGATKRAAELALFEVGSQHQLPFAAVRFGNVLGSRGSVVPTFLRQILDGGPVTVTDPDMTRYFMTIPEAVSLVLQTAAMAEQRKVFLLEMGSPISIIDLARQMIRLAGLRPGDDIEIKVTGARPGERLHEQLHDVDECVEATTHSSICAVTPKTAPDQQTLLFFLGLLERKCTEPGSGPAALSLLEQMLRHCEVECRLLLPKTGTEDDAADLNAGAHEIVLSRPPVRSTAPASEVSRRAAASPAHKLPALLGGEPGFRKGLPFARPTRPPLSAIEQRLRPSYERGILTNGALVEELENRIADRLGVGHAIAVSSCTAGLMLTLQALVDERPGVVVLPSFTFSASAHAITWNGRRPAFVECDPSTFHIDLDHAAERLDGAAALLATHIFGAPCAPDEVVELAGAHGVPVVFDAAHALGARHGDRPIGGFGAAEVFSLTPTKVLVAGEGGLVTTNDTALAERLRIGRNYGDPGNYDTQFAGLNARMSEFHAAVALESLEILDDALERRRRIAALYRELLASVPGVRLQCVPEGDLSTYKDFTICVEPRGFGLTRDQLVQVLRSEGIDTRSYFDPPVHRQRTYRDIDAVDLPITEAVASRVVSLPMYTDLRDDDIESVVALIEAAHHHAEEVDASTRSSEILDLRLRPAGIVEL